MCITFNLFSQKSCGNLLNCLVRSPKTNNVSHVYLNIACFIWAVTIIQYCSFIHRSLSYYTLLLSCQVNAVNIFTGHASHDAYNGQYVDIGKVWRSYRRTRITCWHGIYHYLSLWHSKRGQKGAKGGKNHVLTRNLYISWSEIKIPKHNNKLCRAVPSELGKPIEANIWLWLSFGYQGWLAG